ncbi:MAG: GHKL domain-containing protein, partial [Chitinivibrionales bacterium]|nr:GHKL domain-containing protein [Chitinivibrionales bacterium]MBD3358165.1 GHKL domain-containing protein [Chitinivibrionales bacterium]
VPAPQPIRLYGKARKLEQVIINLVQNACEALQQKDKALTVKVEMHDDKCIISVEDEGRGIPASVMPQLTDPFFTTRRECGGTGLGLAISAGIVKDHGGEITFESKVNKGTIVRVTLPRAESEPV